MKDCGTNGRLTEAEVRLAQRIATGGEETDWINQTEKSLSGPSLFLLLLSCFYILSFLTKDQIGAAKERMSELLSSQAARVEQTHGLNGAMRAHLSVHHQLISDVRSVLKMMAKVLLVFSPSVN